MQLRTMRMRNAAKAGVVSTTPISPIYPTCVANYNTRYLNLPEVQAAIHVDPSTINPKNNGSWKDCGGIDYDFNYESELPNYAAWTASKAYDILIYSGDADFILNHMGSINWITHGLNNSVVQPWRKVSSSVNFVFVCNLFCILNFFSVAHSFVFFVFFVFASGAAATDRSPVTLRSTTASRFSPSREPGTLCRRIDHATRWTCCAASLPAKRTTQCRKV